MKTARVVLATLVAVSLAGCGDHVTKPTSAETISWPADPAEWTVHPGGVGPVELGMSAPDLVELGYAVTLPGHACDQYWQAAPRLRKAGIHLDFALGARDDLDQIIVTSSDGRHDSSVRSDVGVSMGDDLRSLEQAYDVQLLARTEYVEGGPLSVRTVFGAGGALSYAVNDGTVGGMYVTRGTDARSFDFPALGC